MPADHAVRTSRGRWLVAPPGALIASPWEWPTAGGLATLIAAVFIAEILTPYVVVGALALLPVVGAMWLLSNRPAAIVAGLALGSLAVSLLVEVANRWTLVLIAVAILAVSGLVRLQATALAAQLASHFHFDGLTPRELEVARLAGQAYTAAEIGARLHIGERTVETHLANTYTKLRISSRRELIRIARDWASPEEGLSQPNQARTYQTSTRYGSRRSAIRLP